MDVRTNYNSNCPACISIQALIGKEKLETDPANTYWGGGAYQKEVEHLQMGVWPCSDCEGQGFNWITIQETPVFIREKEPCVPCSRMGSIQLHAPLLIGGVHENLLGRAASLLRDYNQNGNCNILELAKMKSVMNVVAQVREIVTTVMVEQRTVTVVMALEK